MQELEKILEEIEQKIEKAEKIIVKPAHDKLDEVANDTAEVFIEAYKECRDIIRNHMNDGWIPVEKKLPNGCYKCEVTLDSGIRSIGWYNKIDYIWFDTKGDIIDVIAWKEPSEPYCPERSDNHDGE